MKPRPPSNPQNLDDLMVMAEDFAGFSLRAGRQIPPTLLAVTKKGPLFFTPASLQDDRSKDDVGAALNFASAFASGYKQTPAIPLG